MSEDYVRELAIADAEERAAKARREVALLKAPADIRGCSESTCPGPKLRGGGCPMGWAGSCKKIGHYG